MRTIHKKVISVTVIMFMALVFLVGCTIQSQREENKSYQNADDGSIVTQEDAVTIVVELQHTSTATMNNDITLDIDSIHLVYNQDDSLSLPLRENMFALDSLNARGMLISAADITVNTIEAILVSFNDVVVSGSTDMDLEFVGDNQLRIPFEATLLDGALYVISIAIDTDRSLKVLGNVESDSQITTFQPFLTVSLVADASVTVTQDGYMQVV